MKGTYRQGGPLSRGAKRIGRGALYMTCLAATGAVLPCLLAAGAAHRAGAQETIGAETTSGVAAQSGPGKINGGK